MSARSWRRPTDAAPCSHPTSAPRSRWDASRPATPRCGRGRTRAPWSSAPGSAPSPCPAPPRICGRRRRASARATRAGPGCTGWSFPPRRPAGGRIERLRLRRGGGSLKADPEPPWASPAPRPGRPVCTRSRPFPKLRRLPWRGSRWGAGRFWPRLGKSRPSSCQARERDGRGLFVSRRRPHRRWPPRRSRYGGAPLRQRRPRRDTIVPIEIGDYAAAQAFVGR
jgi:hypothetical protein